MGGMERASVNLATSLFEAGVDVTFVAMLKHEHAFKLPEGVGFHEPADFNSKRLAFFTTLSWLRKVVTACNPDSVIVYNKFFGALTLLALTGTRIPVIVSERSSPFYPWPTKLRIFHRIVYWFRRPIVVVAQTGIAAEVQKRYYGAKVPVQVIPNVLRKVHLHPGVTREKAVVAIGRLGEFNKGFDRVVSAFALCKLPDWKLWFAGPLNGSAYLDEEIDRLGIRGRIEFLGPVSDIDAVLARASIFVIASRSEGFPNALCEAMAAGLACVSLDFIAGPRDIIDNNVDGVIVGDNRIEELAIAMERLMKDSEERARLGTNAMAISNRLGKEKIAARYLNLLKSNGISQD